MVRPHPGHVRGNQLDRVRLQRGQDSVPRAATHFLLWERPRVPPYWQQRRPGPGKSLVN